MPEKILTFELPPGKDSLEIHTSEEGLRELIESFNRVLRTGQHEHLMTPGWGGTELTQDLQGTGNQLINKVSLFLWDTEEKKEGGG